MEDGTLGNKDSSEFKEMPFFNKRKSTFTPSAGRDTYLDFYIEAINQEILNSLPKKFRYINISKEELQCLRRLSNDPDIIIKKANTSSTIVILNKADYTREVERQLHNEIYYEKLDVEFSDIVEKNVLNCISEISEENERIVKEFDALPDNIRIPQFYILPKIHKLRDDTLPLGYPGRPIVSACNSHTDHVSKYIDYILKTHFPTREKNTLDLILTTLPGQFQDVHSPDKVSDHDIVSGTLRIFIPPIKKPRRKVYLYQKGDYESMRKDTLEFAKEKYFNGHSDTRSVQENFDLLTSFIQDSADKHIPSKTSRSVSSIPWITPEIRRKIRRKNKTHAKAKKTGSSKLRSKFETLRREIKADVRKQHDLYVNNLVGDVKANPRDFYRYINSQKKDTQGIPPLKRKNGKGVAQSDLEKAEEFNGQFTDVFSKNEHTQVPLLDRCAPFMNDIAVSKDGVIKLLKGLNPSKALGPDELHPRVLKELATELGPVFAHLFQQSIDTGEIPKEWSLANICPLFKKSDRSLACNYRPVSLTCVPCKLLEHIVCSNIMAHLDEYKLLSDRQHAFRKGHSCETQLTTVINDWAKILDNRGQVDTFILDFEKAFDTPPHELLKSKLFRYGIGGKTLKWIDSFLCFRQQRVVVNGVKSDWAPVLSGVPQGTVLGPLLFSLYINDISSDIESEIRLFADDCVCYREIKDEEDTLKLQRDIDRLGSWARKWGMRFQPVKCNMMQLTRKRIKKIHASYTLEGTNLENVESIKYLGVTITTDLRWNTHVSNVCTKANRTLGFLRRNLYSCPQEVKEAAYKGLVRPVLDYGSSVWDPSGVVLQEELESVQKRAARFVTGNYNYETGSMTGILGQLKWESLKKRRKDNRLILLYKGLKGKASVPTDDLIPKTRRCRNQHSMAFQTPIANTDVYKGSFFPQTIRDWNALPDSLISSAEDAEDCVAKFTSLVRARD